VRQNVSVFISYDEGATWPVKKIICPTVGDYSSLCILPDGTIGAYVEEQPGNNGLYTMYYSNFSLDWLSSGTDTYYAAGTIEVVATPTFSLKAGTYIGDQTVTLATTTADAKIYYTIDGSIPTASSIPYTTAITLSANTTIKAIAIKTGMANSSVAAADYKIRALGEYCKDDRNRSTADSKTVRSITVTGATVDGAAQSFVATNPNASYQTKIYVDMTDQVLKATQGDDLVFKLAKNALTWMHFYAFVDYNHNYEFDADELVSYTYYAAGGKNAQPGLDSKGVSHSTNEYCPNELPSFTIPNSALTGNTRVRLNVFWNSNNPCTYPDIVAESASTLDFTINIAKNPSGIHNSSSDNLVSFVNNDGHIVVEGAEIGSLIEVYDIAGAEIAKASVQSNSEVLSSVQLSSASYLVKISDKKSSVVKKVIKK
ncbi:MAG: chitobiase/beta-hexosaminidase C-terminal domain-containing protein, partial [Bacteroidaceae bacterium]